MKKLLLLTLTLTLSAPCWAFRSGFNMEPFDWKSIHVPMKKGVCFFHKASQDIQDFSRFAIDRLVQTAELNKSQCEPLLADALEIKAQMKNYFDNLYSEKGITRDDGDTVIKLNCNNAEEVFRLQLYNYRLYASRGRTELDDFKNNIFYGKCRDETQYTLLPGVTNLDQCLKDTLAEALKDFRAECDEPAGSIRNKASTWRTQIKAQETAMNATHEALHRIFELVKSEKCFGAEDVAKAAIQSSITLGASVAGTAFGGPAGAIGASIGAEAINFMIEYLFKFAERRDTIQEIISDKNYENSVCMWISLQEKMCQQFSIIPADPVEKRSCGIRDDKDLTNSIDLLDSYKDLSTFHGLGEDENGPTAEPGYKVALEDLLDLTFKKNGQFPPLNKKEKVSNSEVPLKTLGDILTNAEPFFKKYSKDDYNSLLKVKDSLAHGRMLLDEYNLLFGPGPVDEDVKAKRRLEIYARLAKKDEPIRSERQAKETLLREMGKTLQEIEKIDLTHLMEIYLTFKVKGKSGLDQLLAEEMSMEIFKSFNGKLDSYLDNVDELESLNNGAVEVLKPLFKTKLWTRYRTSLKNARAAENTHIKIADLSREELRRRRLATFAQLRDTLKDCISTPAIFFSNRKKQNIFETYFTMPQMAANLKINRSPTRYLKACSPFMCDGGIPIPHLPSEDEAPIHFQQYSCQVLNQSEEIIRKLRNSYVESGTVCGKTIHEITNGKTELTKYNPLFRGVRKLKNFILRKNDATLDPIQVVEKQKKDVVFQALVKQKAEEKTLQARPAKKIQIRDEEEEEDSYK